MLVTVLPFFLAAQLVVDEKQYPARREPSRWSHGPECTYQVLVNITVTAGEDQSSERFCTIISTDLKCRPQGEDTLSCRFDHPRHRSPAADPALSGCKRRFIGRNNRFVGLGNFEVRFNRRGVENLVVPRTIPRHKLDIIKAVVNQLNTGFDLLDPRQNLSLMENGTAGYCQVQARLNLVGPTEADHTFHGFDLQLQPPRPTVNLSEGTTLEIQKLRNPRKCPQKPIYLFSHTDEHDKLNRSVFMEMVYSIGRMTISKNSFSSYTASEGVVKSPEGKVIALPFQSISLTLKSINPARETIPQVYQPASTGLHTYSTLGYSSALVRKKTLI